MQIVLHQFRASHFNDKARWALAFKGLAHERVTYLPGPHRGPITKLSGQSSTPVAVIDGEVFAGSAEIIEALEARRPSPALYPADPQRKEAALAIQTRFDQEVGPASRAAVFSVFVDELDLATQVFAVGEPLAKRLAYRAMLPMARGLIAKINGADTPEKVARAIETVDRTLDWLAAETRNRPFLVGDDFTVADLSAAALLGPIARVDHPDMRLPEPLPPAFAALLSRWEAHPGLEWVRARYREQRPLDAQAA